MKPKTFVFVALLLMLMLACSLTKNTGGNPTNPGQAVTVAPGVPGVPGANETATPAPDPVPVSINEGLASLNSYAMTVMIKSVGPDPAQSSTTTIQRQRSNDTNASYTSTNVTVVKPDGGDPSVTDTSIYQVGNDQCSGNDTDSWSWSSSTPAEAEMNGLVTSMIGLSPLIDNPSFVAVETVNGIPSNHFTFKVSGLGATSGAVVNLNQGDYWLAVDGNYIVKYTLVVETSQAADAKVLHEEISIEMNQVNQPVNIAFPQGCLDASKVTPTP
jgi:hypothetical protein